MKKKLNYWNSIFLLFTVSLFLTTSSCSKKVEKPVTPIVKPVTPPTTQPPASTSVAIVALSPNTGLADAEINIVGDNFGNSIADAKVTFGAKDATITSFSKQLIKVKAPAGAGSAKVDVLVTVGTKVSNKIPFDYSNTTLPAITATSANCFYNSTVVLTGTNFSSTKENNVVRFGNLTATVLAASTTSLTVQTPELGAVSTALVNVTSTGVTSASRGIPVEMDQNKVATYPWTTHTVRTGLLYKSGQFELFGASPRSIYILDVTLNASNILGIGFSTNNATTTAMCTNFGGVAGVNAGYFPLGGASDKDGYVRMNGTMAQAGHLNVSQIFTNSALIINNNVASVRKFTETHKNLNQVAAAIPVASAANIIVCGPMLITDNVIEALDMNTSHNYSKTSRTGLGVSADGKRVFLVVIDSGNGPIGMTTLEVAKVLQALGSVNAMNLDGGGSSTMYVKNKGDNGRVNFPYGATTQRSIRSVIYVK